MVEKKIKITKGQYLKDIFSELPSNCILFKVLTGIGATHLEINSPRHSIIIEPNVPVIRGKKKAHKGKILGVYEGVYVPDIIRYLNDPKVPFKKIMTTPESFNKIKEAIAQTKMNMYKDFFLMFDECDRTSKDVDFRPDIILPMEDFFLFDRKAFVSATATIPSDPRFEKQGFHILEVVPEFDYAKPLNFIQTNNPFVALSKCVEHIVKEEENEKLFIFLNSTLGIVSIIEQMKLQKICAVFCSKGSSVKIKDSSGIDVFTDITNQKFKKINFFTSRFYSAVDINVEQNPHVIVMTDLNIADYTMIDPFSDLIQISGRFRNIELASLTFIANQKLNLNYRNKDEAKSYLDGCEETYRTLESLRDVSTEQAAKEILNEALERVSFAKFITEGGQLNYFMKDNYLQKEVLKSFYSNIHHLKYTFYDDILTKQFKVSFYDYPFNVPSFYPKVQGVYKHIDTVKAIANFLENVYSSDVNDFVIDIKRQILDDLTRKQPKILEAYNKLGKETLCKIGYSTTHIDEALREHEKKLGQTSNFDFLDELNNVFRVSDFYTGTDIREKFTTLVEKYKLPYLNKKKYMNDFGRFFKLSKRTTRKKQKGYVIQEKFFN